MTALPAGRTPTWRTLPARWSRGLRRRARGWWRRGIGENAGSIEQGIAEFIAACAELRNSANLDRRQRWSRLLSQLGECALAASLVRSQEAPVESPAPRLVRADALCARLDRLLARIQETFSHDLQSLPTTIAAHDARSAALLDWASELPTHASLLDVGCGSGRFLHLLAERLPTLRLTGLDPAATSLRSLGQGIQALRGGMLTLPLSDHSFDAAIAIESLEHSLRPQRAIQEMVRVLKPGGRLFIVDKNRRLQSRCEHEFWERWFDLPEVSAWLSTAADVDRAEPLPPDGHEVPPQLFYLWTATKRIPGVTP